MCGVHETTHNLVLAFLWSKCCNKLAIETFFLLLIHLFLDILSRLHLSISCAIFWKVINTRKIEEGMISIQIFADMVEHASRARFDHSIKSIYEATYPDFGKFGLLFCCQWRYSWRKYWNQKDMGKLRKTDCLNVHKSLFSIKINKLCNKILIIS